MCIRQKLIPILAVFFVGCCGAQLYAQALYSYLDQNGYRVLTNIPPVQPVYDLQITGSPPEPAPPPTPAVKATVFDPIIEKYAAHYSLDPSLIKSIIATESGFNPNAVSPKGARGLMQLMPATAQRLGVKNSFDPEENIRGGVKHFRTLMDNFNNDLTLSLAAYNAGENLVQRLGRVPEIKETQNYIKMVTSRLDKKDANPSAEEQPERLPTYRYIDESGVLHLTNIPPSDMALN